MPSIQIRNVPDRIYRRLVEQAEKEHRSLAQQTLAVLARGLEVDLDPRARRHQIVQGIRAASRGNTGKLSNPVQLVRQDRRR